jgi:hypothetical protein
MSGLRPLPPLLCAIPAEPSPSGLFTKKCHILAFSLVCSVTNKKIVDRVLSYRSNRIETNWKPGPRSIRPGKPNQIHSWPRGFLFVGKTIYFDILYPPPPFHPSGQPLYKVFAPLLRQISRILQCAARKKPSGRSNSGDPRSDGHVVISTVEETGSVLILVSSTRK